MKNTPIIFVIEDNLIVQELIEFRIKKKLKCIISKFTNSEDALERMKASKPDLIVLDYQLDKYDNEAKSGLRFLQELKNTGKKIPTVILSGQQDKMVAVEMIREGAVDYVSKDSDHFLDRIEEAITKTLKVIKLQTNRNSQRNRKQRFLKRAKFILSATVVSLTFIWILNLVFG